MPFADARDRPPFDDVEKRRELLRRFNEIPGVMLPEDSIERRSSTSLTTLVPEEALTQFNQVMEWYLNEVRQS